MALTYNDLLLSIDEEITCGCNSSGIGYMGTVNGHVYPVTFATGVSGASLANMDAKVVAIATDDTTVFFATDKGDIYGITIATGALSGVLAHVDQGIIGMLVATYLYVGLNDGRVIYYTIS